MDGTPGAPPPSPTSSGVRLVTSQPPEESPRIQGVKVPGVPGQARMLAALARQGPDVGTKKKQLQQFLGFVGYYSCFIENFASKAEPLIDCLGKGEPDTIQWTLPQIKAFKVLRESFSGQPVLDNPDFQVPFDLAADASGVGTGAVLSQHREGQHLPILFISQKL